MNINSCPGDHAATNILVDVPNISGELKNIFRKSCCLPSVINLWRLRSAVQNRFGQIRSARAYVSARAEGLAVVRRASRSLHDSDFDVEVVWQTDARFDKNDPVDSAIRAEVFNSANNNINSTLVVAACDGGYASWLKNALSCGLRVVVIGFLERFPESMLKLREYGAVLLDLEHDLRAVWQPLPNRMRPDVLARLGLKTRIPVQAFPFQPIENGVEALFAAAGV
jgi:hypothetical protein